MKNNKITQICEVMLINLKLSYILNISFACQTFERSEFFLLFSSVNRANDKCDISILYVKRCILMALKSHLTS